MLIELNDLRKCNLLGKPFVFLELPNNNTEIIYLSDNVKQKISNYKLNKLTEGNHKVYLKFKLKMINNYKYSDNLVELRLEKGKTNFTK